MRRVSHAREKWLKDDGMTAYMCYFLFLIRCMIRMIKFQKFFKRIKNQRIGIIDKININMSLCEDK